MATSEVEEFDIFLKENISNFEQEFAHDNENSPSHDSNSSTILSPNVLDENESVHDADSDSSGSEFLSFDSTRSEVSRRKKRRTSSNVFIFQNKSPARVTKTEYVNEDVLSQFGLENDNPAGVGPSTTVNDSAVSKDNKVRKNHQRVESLSTSGGEETGSDNRNEKRRKNTAVDGLLFEIYDKYQRTDSHCVDSDITELSTTSVTSVYLASSFENDDRSTLDKTYLETKDIKELEKMVWDMKRSINMLNSKLVRLLKQRDRHAHKIQDNFNILTALLQAVSQKRRVDTRIRFSFIPRPGKKGFRQWIDALKSVARIHPGIPPPWRKRTWLSLAEFFLKDVEWDKIRKVCFNDRKNPDDDELDTQIVKDLHRTGCGWFFEHDSEEDRASLKRVLLAYARWNKSIGYCQGFNVIAALILQVMEGVEEDALKVMIFLVDYVLPRNYFANNLRALSVDMAVLRDLMAIKLAHLSQLLERLQKDAMDKTNNSTASYEPPLINMFTMQWFLTLFATCLPRNTVLRIWDSVLLEGSEVLLRVALAIWAKLGTYFDNLYTAADFYMQMGRLIQDMMLDEFIHVDKLVETVYQMSPFPWTTISELREKYTYDIHPFSTFNGNKKSDKKHPPKHMQYSTSHFRNLKILEIQETFVTTALALFLCKKDTECNGFPCMDTFSSKECPYLAMKKPHAFVYKTINHGMCPNNYKHQDRFNIFIGELGAFGENRQSSTMESRERFILVIDECFCVVTDSVEKNVYNVLHDKALDWFYPYYKVSDDEVLDSEDEKMIGCLGFVAASSSMDHGSTSSSKNQTSNDKSKMGNVCPQADITKVTPGAYISDQDHQNSYKAQIKRKELIRETEKLDLNKLKQQYGRMRRLQHRAMLVFSSNDFKDDTYRSANPPSAINHLFVDVSKVAPPRTKYRKPSNFPVLKAPSKGNSAGFKPAKESKTRVVHESNGNVDVFLNSTQTNESRTFVENENSFTSPYITRNVQTLQNQMKNVTIDETNENRSTEKSRKHNTKTIKSTYETDLTSLVKTEKNGSPSVNSSKGRTPSKTSVKAVSSSNTSDKARHRKSLNDRQLKDESELKSTSPLYQVDKSAMYPTNFKPFPHRNPKRKPLTAK